jgi:hypothetical protein
VEYPLFQDDGGGFLVLKSETGWSIDDPSELLELLDRTRDLWAPKECLTGEPDPGTLLGD